MSMLRHCPECGKRPVGIETCGIYVTSCLGHKIKPAPAGNRRNADEAWNAAVERYLAEGGQSVPAVKAPVVVDERPKQRAPIVPQSAESVDMSAVQEELHAIGKRVEHLTAYIRSRLVGVRVRHNGRACYVTNARVIDHWGPSDLRIGLELWAPRKDNPLKQYFGEFDCRLFSLSQVEILPPEVPATGQGEAA